MKMVIDMPDETVNAIKDNAMFGVISDEILWDVTSAIVNGTPLPKGHGRLIDADSMKTIKNIQSANFNAIELIRFWIDNQPTIIKADKEGANNE